MMMRKRLVYGSFVTVCDNGVQVEEIVGVDLANRVIWFPNRRRDTSIFRCHDNTYFVLPVDETGAITLGGKYVKIFSTRGFQIGKIKKTQCSSVA